MAGAVGAVRAVAAGGDTVRASWLPPAGPVTHYTLYTRELGKYDTLSFFLNFL